MTKVKNYVKKRDKCQHFTPMKHQLVKPLNLIVSPWPFAKWGLVIVSKLPRLTRGNDYVLITIDYFTKWVTTKACSMVN